MRVVMSVPIPGPADAGIENLLMASDLFEARTIDPPDIAVFRRQGAAVGDVIEASPGKRKLGGPSAVRVPPAVHDSIDMHRMTQPRKIPIEKSPTLAARMHVTADSIEHHGALRRGIEFGPAEVLRTGHQNILPDPKDFVDGIERVDLELVICVGAGDEHFEVVLFIDLRVAFRQRAPDVGLLGGESEVE